MQTIKDITQRLQQLEEPNEWITALQHDQRQGVQKALQSWQRKFEKRKALFQAFQAKCDFDASYLQGGKGLLAGVDEAGRGPLAGPVVTAAVILPLNATSLIELDDSKKLSKAKREQLANEIRDVAIDYAIHIQSVDAIDQQNIYIATRQSMELAVTSLQKTPHIVLVDAMELAVPYESHSIIKGDAQSLAIAAASILAKTTRDAIMEQLHKEFPYYHFHQNAGYGTADHIAALKKFGPTKHHRKSFEPIKSMLMKGDQDGWQISVL